ncbi:MAG: hypothetical protein ABS46_16670 [Cytophagaceae bacterium SCN 52-12]|nr:MAG: hypothetical protein ABS46_16670 [Cytophagaceae bacterium SCN 52-12]
MSASFLLPLAEIEEKVALTGSMEEASYAIADEIAVLPASMAEKATADVSAVQIFLGIYLCGTALSLILLLARLLKTFSLLRSYPRVLTEDLPVTLLDGHQTGSFSFFNRIFISRPDFEHHFDTVYNHEKIHVRQKHSFDILLTELCQVFLWFNPVIRLYKHALQEVHEFLADTSATNRESYARFLVSYAMSETDKFPMTHPFLSRLTLKQRIRMLYREPDSGYKLGRYLLIIPLAAALVALTASRHYVYISDSSAPAESPQAEIPPMTIKTVEQPMAPAGLKADDRKISGRVVDAADNKPLPAATVLVKGSHTGTTTDSDGFYTLTVPADHREIVFSFVGFTSQTVSIDGKTRIDAALSKSRNEIEEIVVVGYGPLKPRQEQADTTSSRTPGSFLAVEEMPEFPGGNKELLRFLAKHIRYPGEAVRAGVQGKVYLAFTINKEGHIRAPRVLQGLGYGTDEEALRVVTSMPRWKPARQNQQPVSVEYTLPISFVLEQAEEKKEENKQGYVPRRDTIHTESEVRLSASRIEIRGVEPLPEESYFSSRYELSQLLDKPRTGFSRNENAPLYLVDGKEKYSLDGLEPNTIASITVLKKGANLVSEYGPRAKNGVIIVTLKK